MAKRKKDKFTSDWILENSLEVLQSYTAGSLTIRALHYRLVARGMTNSTNHYKRVIYTMKKARWEGLVPFGMFADHDREVIGKTEAEEVTLEDELTRAKSLIEYVAGRYDKNRWQNQPNYVEVWIEKKALQGAFAEACESRAVALAPCKGYPSLTFLHEAAKRFEEFEDKDIVIIYFGDYDPSGEDIPRSIEENLEQMGADVQIDRVALHRWQVEQWQLPPQPAKLTDSRTQHWDGIGQVELDAVDPTDLDAMATDAIDKYFDGELYEELLKEEAKEAEEYRNEMKKFLSDRFGFDEE